jgi:hypothetical protein
VNPKASSIRGSVVNPLTLVLGFVPLVLFTFLDGRIPVAEAALIGAIAAIIVVAITARRTVPVLPIVQTITLAIITVIAFTGDHATQVFLGSYGRGIASLVLAAYMLITAPFAPFTATIARVNVPREYWKSPRFIALNRKISAVWGVAILVLGITHLITGAMGPLPRFQELLIQWGPAVVVVIIALRYTQRVTAETQTRSAAPR